MLICMTSAGKVVLPDSLAERQRKQMQVPISQPSYNSHPVLSVVATLCR